MLSRTADNLYWLSRYMERADFVARILDATLRLAVPAARPTAASATNGRAPSPSAGDPDAFKRLYDVANEDTVRDFLAFSPNNPSSIRTCIETARENARSVRTALTIEMWDAINGAWLELQRIATARDDARASSSRFLDWVKRPSPRLRRLGLPDDAAQRRLLVHAARQRHRAGRQHRPHPRRQVPRAAAGHRAGRRRRSTISSGRRSCARSRRSPPITGSTARASSPGWSPTS